jgi:hypothetical protein
MPRSEAKAVRQNHDGQNDSALNGSACESERQLRKLAAFCMTPLAAPCFKDWPEDTIVDYLAFHAMNGSLAFVRSEGAGGQVGHPKGWTPNGAAHGVHPLGCPIIGLAIGWQRRSDAPHASWEKQDPNGDEFYFEQLVAATPDALRSLVLNFEQRWPQWRTLKLKAHRRNRIVHYIPRAFQKLVHLSKNLCPA